MCGPGVQQLRDPAFRRDHCVAGADAPPEPRGLRGGILEAGPQQFPAAEIGGIVHCNVEQPDVSQITGQQDQDGYHRETHADQQLPVTRREDARSDGEQADGRHRHGVCGRSSGAGQHQDQEVDDQQQQVATATLAVELDQTGVDRRQAYVGQERGVAQTGEAGATAVHEQWSDIGCRQRQAGHDGYQRAPFGRSDDRLGPGSGNSNKAEDERGHGPDHGAQRIRHRYPGIQAVRQADGGHRQKRPCWAERVRAWSEAHHAEEPKADFDPFHDRDGRLKGVFSDQVAERHLQGHSWSPAARPHRRRSESKAPGRRRRQRPTPSGGTRTAEGRSSRRQGKRPTARRRSRG